MAKVEHEGYVIHQNDCNHHYMIFKGKNRVLHVPCDVPLSEDELVERIEDYIRLRDALFAEGDILQLPCKLGSTVYIIGGPKYRAGSNEYWINTGKFRPSDLEKWERTVFGTEADAEAKLRLIAEKDSRFRRV